jgi:predicted nucleic acid-binding protein
MPGFFMKVYHDANIYITYLLGQKGEVQADLFFKQGIGCRFSIVASKTVFAEIAQRCGGQGIIILQNTVDNFKKAGKLEIWNLTAEDTGEATTLNIQAGLRFGHNDMEHALIARKSGALFVTNDRKLARHLNEKFKQGTIGLEEFVESEP